MKKKKIIVILSLLFILTFINFVNNDMPNVKASEYVVNVSTENEFMEVLSNASVNSSISITLIEDIELHQKIELNGYVNIQAKEQKEIKLLAKSYFDLRNGVEATFTNINIIKSADNKEAQTILFRDNSKQGFVHFYNCNLSTEGDSNLIVLNSTSINGRYYLDNTNISGSETSCSKGSIYLSGTTKITNVGANVLVYDFRECNVEATPGFENFDTSDKVYLNISQKPTFWKGTPDDVQKFNVDIYYTLDGSDPVTSSTRIHYNNNNPISLIIDRQIKATVISDEICYSIGVDEFNYDVNENKTPGDIISVTPCDSLIVRCLTKLDIKDFPEAVEIVLSDGRKIYALADWNISTIDINTEGVYSVYANLTTPYFVSNPNNLKGQMDVEVYYHEIEEFSFTANNPMQVGKNTNVKDYVIGEFSAKGGDETNYTYTLSGDSNFYIEGDELKLKSSLPAGIYDIEVTVESANQTATTKIELEVLDMAYEKIVSLNPYEGINWDSVNFVSSALHNHTWFSNKEFEESEHNDSSFDTADERIAAYKALGFGAVIITEHDYVTLDYYNGKFSDNDILTIYGNEMSKKYHTLYYGLEPYYDKRGQGISVTNGIEGNIQNIAAMNGNGIVYFAHPNRSTTDPEYWYNLFSKYDVVYGMEVFNAGQAKKNYSENVWDYILTKSMPNRPIWGTASDDAHSNGAISTGWQIMLLADDQMNAQGLFDCLKNGNSFLTTICINPETDDDIMYGNVIGDIPYFTSVIVNEGMNKITVTAENYIKLEWVSANGRVVSNSPTLDLNTTYGIDKYVRCRIYGTGGMSHTQPIGIADGNNLFAGEQEDNVSDNQPSISGPEQNIDSDTSVSEPNTNGCNGSITISFFAMITLCCITITLNKRKDLA